MLITGLCPLRVKLENGGIRNPKLSSQGLDHRPGNSQRIRQEPAQDPHRSQLHGESQTVVHPPAAAGYRQIGIIQPAKAFQVLPRYLIREPPEPGGLLIT